MMQYPIGVTVWSFKGDVMTDKILCRTCGQEFLTEQKAMECADGDSSVKIYLEALRGKRARLSPLPGSPEERIYRIAGFSDLKYEKLDSNIVFVITLQRVSKNGSTPKEVKISVSYQFHAKFVGILRDFLADKQALRSFVFIEEIEKPSDRPRKKARKEAPEEIILSPIAS
jgi:hypothetical protein